MRNLLAGKKAIITGSSRGIGRATAIEFGRNGADVVINYRTRKSEAEDVAVEVEKLGRKALVLQASVSDRQAVDAMFAKAEQEYGRIDILVNNAGIVADTLLLRMGETDWDQVIDTNLKGVFYCSKAAMR